MITDFFFLFVCLFLFITPILFQDCYHYSWHSVFKRLGIVCLETKFRKQRKDAERSAIDSVKLYQLHKALKPQPRNLTAAFKRQHSQGFKVSSLALKAFNFHNSITGDLPLNTLLFVQNSAPKFNSLCKNEDQP